MATMATSLKGAPVQFPLDSWEMACCSTKQRQSFLGQGNDWITKLASIVVISCWALVNFVF